MEEIDTGLMAAIEMNCRCFVKHFNVTKTSLEIITGSSDYISVLRTQVFMTNTSWTHRKNDKGKQAGNMT